MFGRQRSSRPDLPARVLFSVGVLVRLPCAPERDLIVRESSAFLNRRSLALTVVPDLRRLLRNLTDVDRMSAVNWSNHFWSPKGKDRQEKRED